MYHTCVNIGNHSIVKPDPHGHDYVKPR